MGKRGVLPGIVQVLHDVTFRLLSFQPEWAIPYFRALARIAHTLICDVGFEVLGRHPNKYCDI